MSNRNYMDAWMCVYMVVLLVWCILNKCTSWAFQRWKVNVNSIDGALNEWTELQKIEYFMFPVSLLISFIIVWIPLELGMYSIFIHKGYTISDWEDWLALFVLVGCIIRYTYEVLIIRGEYRRHVRFLLYESQLYESQSADSTIIRRCAEITGKIREHTMFVVSCTIPFIWLFFEYTFDIRVYFGDVR